MSNSDIGAQEPSVAYEAPIYRPSAPTTGGQSEFDRAVVAVYHNHPDAEEGVRVLERAGLPMKQISIIGRNFELREDMQGYYRPADAAVEGAGAGAWVGGLFGLLWGFGFFLLPIAGPLF